MNIWNFRYLIGEVFNLETSLIMDNFEINLKFSIFSLSLNISFKKYQNIGIHRIIVLKSDPARQVDPGPGRSMVGTEPDLRQNRKRQWGDPATWSKTRLQPVDFFLSKRHRFNLKKRIDLDNQVKTRWLGQNQKSKPWTRSNLKTMHKTQLIGTNFLLYS